MKKATLFAAACALFLGAQSLSAQETVQEVTFVSDPTQGVLVNRMKDNWFITAEGGADFWVAPLGVHRQISDRFSPAASFYVGKWFSPVFGGRVGFSYLGLKGLADGSEWIGTLQGEPLIDNRYTKTRFNEFGPVFDLMINLTNWWCGYRPGRVYNATLYAGAGAYFTYVKDYDAKGESHGYKYAKDDIMALRAGLINTFNLSKHFALSIDLRATGLSALKNQEANIINWNHKSVVLQGFLGLTYKFNNTEWNAPIVPVFPEPENCDALRARLAAADARIADLEAQLKDCLNRPVETVEVNNGPLATIYYPIGVSRLSRENQRVVKAIAHVMTQDTSKKYTVTGWADNYTGTDNINIRLRKNRAEGVAKLLKANGVADSQLNVTTNNGNLSDLGEKCVALDRAVTIEEAK